MTRDENMQIPVVVEPNPKETEDLASDFVAEELFQRFAEGGKLLPVSDKFWARSPGEQVLFLRKLSRSYHDAAIDLQRKFGEVNKLLFSKEEQITRLQQSMGMDRAMIHQQLERLNFEKQQILAENVRLQEQITMLEAQLRGK